MGYKGITFVPGTESRRIKRVQVAIDVWLTESNLKEKESTWQCFDRIKFDHFIFEAAGLAAKANTSLEPFSPLFKIKALQWHINALLIGFDGTKAQTLQVLHVFVDVMRADGNVQRFLQTGST